MRANFGKIIGEEKQNFLGWRDIPADNVSLGATAKDSQPTIKQIFIGEGGSISDDAQFDQKLFIIRRWAKELMTRVSAVVHSQFSINTFPSWSRAQPLRYIAHNGEINALRGNINWMNARQDNLKSTLFGEDSPKVLHVIDRDASDSGAFDNSLETLT